MPDRIHPYIPRLVEQFELRAISRREFLRTATLLGLSAATAYGIAGLAPGAAVRAATPRKGGVLRVATTVYDVNAPWTASTTAHPLIYAQVVETLTRTGADNVTRGHLLEGWEVSDDLRSWTLRIREGVTWHTGRPFVAEDVVWNLTQQLSDAAGSSLLGLMKGYMLNEFDTGQKNDRGRPILRHELWDANAFEVVDDRTVRMNLKAPQLAVAEHLFHYPAVMLYPEDGGTFGVGRPGTGAFTLKEIEPGRIAVLEAREGYWGEGPYLDRFEIIDLGGSEQAIANALASKQVDGAFGVAVDFVPMLDAQGHLRKYEVVTADTAVTRMNVNNPPFDDARVRKAMRLAVDARTVSDLTFGPFADPAEHHHVSPIQPDYASLPPFTRDVAAAKALLAEAGHPNGIDATLVIQQNPPHHLRNATAMVEQWKEAGIRVEINIVPNPQYWDIWTTTPLGMTVWAHRPLGVINLALAYRSGVAWNESAFSSPEFDRLLDEAEAVADPVARRAPMAKLQAILQEEGPLVQTYWRKLFTFYDARVQGYALHPIQQVFAHELSWGEA